MLYELRYFAGSDDARTYRHENGTGGWIFAPDNGGPAVLFPPHMPPSDIFRRPATRGQSGNLIGCQ